MLHHQALLSSSSSSTSFFSSPSKPLSFFHLPYSHSSQVEKERRLMELPLSSSAACVNDYGDEGTSLVDEKNDGVSIDEYLADEYFLEIETVDEEDETRQQRHEEEGEGKPKMGFGGENSSNSPSVLSFEAPPLLSVLSLPTHDVAELEWVSMIMDESLSEIPKTYESLQLPPKIKIDGEAQNQALPPPPPFFVPTKAKRSKRARNISGSWSSPASSSSSTATTTTSSSTSSASSSTFSSPQLILAHHLFDEAPHPASKPPAPPSKKRGRKPKAAASDSPTEGREVASWRGERRCSHCGVNKTPQWRAGPHGAKTLCNACGVRYKSGRLLPEYRPACSPTFLSHVHSNSHRKVLEMRRKKEEREADKLLLVCSAPPVASF